MCLKPIYHSTLLCTRNKDRLNPCPDGAHNLQVHFFLNSTNTYTIYKKQKNFLEFIIITEIYLYQTIHFGKLKAVLQMNQAIYYELDYEA